nr:NTP binding domain [Red clover-associated virus 1]
MNCLPCAPFSSMKGALDLLEENETMGKIVDMVNQGHKLTTEKQESIASIAYVAKDLVPLIDSCKRLTGSVEKKLDYLSSLRKRIMKIVLAACSESIPGMIKTGLENEEYMWATVLTIIGGCSILYACTRPGKYWKRMSVLMMVIWSPFLMHKAFQLGSWIKDFASKILKWNFTEMKPQYETCRKHSLAGAAEYSEQFSSSFMDWFSANWTSVTQKILSLLGVVASLIIWGTIPDEKKIKGFGAKFKAAGEKGRSFTNIFSGFSSINKMCSEWSNKLVSWILSMSDHSLPKADHALKHIIDFDLREWVEETRNMALEENKFKGFGGETYLHKVRSLYDRSTKIQSALLDGAKVDFQLHNILTECKKKCDQLLNESYTFRGMKQPRVDPLHICMIGKPGVGKSTLTHVLINNLLDYRGEPEVDRIFTRCCADQYWSNYHQEPVILYDDLGAINSKIKMSDYAEIMGIKTNDPYSVPMAGVDEKGRHCTSKYVFSCTNMWELDDTGDIATKAAFYRRRNVLVEVEKDPEVERSEIDPTQGLLFSVYDCRVEGERAVFEIKENWGEHFLRDVNTGNWRMERVSYKTFFKFLCVYTDAYMDSQEKLLKGIKTFKMDTKQLFEDDVEAQAHEKIMTVGQMIETFDSWKFPAKMLYKQFKQTKYLPPEGWNTDKILPFQKLLESMCGCSEGNICTLEIMMTNIGHLLQGKDQLTCHKSFVLKSMKKDPSLIELKLLAEPKEIFEKHNVLSIFHTLVTYIRWTSASDMCFFHFSNLNPSKSKVSKIKYDHRLTGSMEKLSSGHKIFRWQSVNLLFPSAMLRNGCVALRDDQDFYYLLIEPSAKVNFKAAEDLCVKTWNEGPEVECNIEKVFSREQQNDIACLLRDVTDFGDLLGPNEKMKEIFENARSCFSPCVYVMFLIALLYKKKKVEGQIQQKKVEEMRANKFLAAERFKVYEKENAEKLSRNVKIAMCIGGGIMAVGVLAGLAFGLKSLFSSLSNLAHEDEEEEKVEEAEAESSGAHASDGIQTLHIKGRRKPRLIVKDLVKQSTGAHASDGIQTLHVKKRRGNPLRVIKQDGFGVVYDESTLDLQKSLMKEKRKNVRKVYKQSLEHSIRGCKKKDCNECALSVENKWISLLEKDGVEVSEMKQ